VDRFRANRNIGYGVRAAGIALFLFALTFYVAVLYIS
jgi:hypothetical protein